MDNGFILAQMKEEIEVLESEYKELVKAIAKKRVQLKDKKKAYNIWIGKKERQEKKKEQIMPIPNV